MNSVLYFKVLAIAWGAVMLLRGPVWALLGQKGLRIELDIAYPAKQPFFMWLVAVIGIVLAACTWWMQAKHPIDYSYIATIVVTLGVFKSSQVIFNYARFREFELKLTAGRPFLVGLISLVAALVAAGLILLGVFVYR